MKCTRIVKIGTCGHTEFTMVIIERSEIKMSELSNVRNVKSEVYECTNCSRFINNPYIILGRTIK